MKLLFNCSLLVILMFVTSSKVFAYNIAVENNEGVTIYYNYINNGSELEVTYKGEDYYGFHTGYLELESIMIPSQVIVSGKIYQVTGIGNEAFGGWGRSSSVPYKIRTISIPNSVKYIGNRAFEACKNIISINLPNSLEIIGSEAFEGTSITQIRIPNTVYQIGASAFESTPIEAVVLPNSLTRIEGGTFRGTNLESFIIPSSVTYFGDYALAECGKLESVAIGKAVRV